MGRTQVTAAAKWDEAAGRLRLVDEFAFKVQMKRMQLEDGAQCEITVERLLAARSLAANRAYWGFIVRPVSMFTKGAMSMNDVHRYFKAEHLPSERFVVVDPETGEVKLERNLEVLTTTNLSEEEFRDYMERCRATAMEELGIDMSDRGLYEQFGILTK